MVQQQPGDALLTGQIDGRRLGTALFELGPTLPHESLVPMPRFLARRLFPQGFVPFQQATPTPEVLAQAIQPAPAIQLAPVAAAQPVQAQPQPAPQPASQGYRPVQSGGNPIQAVSQRVRNVQSRAIGQKRELLNSLVSAPSALWASLFPPFAPHFSLFGRHYLQWCRAEHCTSAVAGR